MNKEPKAKPNYVPTGQGLRIKISLEETNTGKTFDHGAFMSYDRIFEHDSPEQRFSRVMEELDEIVKEVFKNQFLGNIVKVYGDK